jgi:hypothetical protein
MQTYFDPDYENFREKLNTREALNLRATLVNQCAEELLASGRLVLLDIKGPKPFKVYVWLSADREALVLLGGCWSRPGEPGFQMMERMQHRVMELNKEA